MTLNFADLLPTGTSQKADLSGVCGQERLPYKQKVSSSRLEPPTTELNELAQDWPSPNPGNQANGQRNALGFADLEPSQERDPSARARLRLGTRSVSWKIIQADAREVLLSLPDESVHCVVTSPPYWGLRDYGVPAQIGLEPTPEAYVSALVAIFREVRRVLRKDGTLWLNLGDSYSGYHGNSKMPDAEAPSNKPGYTENMRATTVGVSGLKPKDLVGVPWRVAFALQADGWYLRSDIIWSKPNPMPESVSDRPTKAHEYLFLLAKSERYFYHAEAIKEPASLDTHARYARGRSDNHKWADGGPGNQTIATNRPGSLFGKVPAGWHQGNRANGSAPRDRRAPGVNPKCTEPGNGVKQNSSFSAAVKDIVEARNKRSVWEIATQPFPEAHFATFPEALVEPCILAGCPEDGTVLDPFCGSGTVGVVALRHRRSFLGIELSPAYCEMAGRRISKPDQVVLALSGAELGPSANGAAQQAPATAPPRSQEVEELRIP